MKPLTKQEIDLYGNRAYAKIPLVVCWGDSKSESVFLNFRQADIYTSIANYVSDKKWTSSWNGDFLNSPRIPAECIFCVRGDNRGIISVYCGDHEGHEKSRFY